MGRVIYSADALSDLNGIRSYIAKFNPGAARQVGTRIIQSVDRLAKYPRFGKPGRITGTRELIIPQFPYCIVYEEMDGDCLVLRVLHQAMQWPVPPEEPDDKA